ncbi:IscA/HesB family protein [Desulforhopalus vacuolatus]|uniref:IscA/HesB family protein n=1 Tax=Desulforhopalus vacuolatus TaxID=40414 RepID=UPI001962B157|nr:IscA/HesB family protein [Desulforhopalus vacuolatus]MBM9521127.1 IscA/HesB family protein [Desulforhopalus vacuolatus]
MAELIVTDIAVTRLNEYLADNSIESALRIALMQGGCSGSSLGLALDEPKDNDKIYDKDKLKFLVEEGIFDTTGDITVDYIDAGANSGFSITSEKPVGGGSCCGSCGSCG